MKKLLLLLALMPFATPVLAEKHQNAFYGELVLGSAKQGPNITGTEKVMDDEFAIGARVGYQFATRWAIEGGYWDYSKLFDRNVLEGEVIDDYFEANAYNVGVKYMVLCKSCDWTLDFRWGATIWDFKYSKINRTSDPGNVISDDDSGIDRYYGFGTSYHYSEHIVVGLEYTISVIKLFEGEESPGVGVDEKGLEPRDFRIRNVSLSIGYRF
jgi:opacity protein-like surface antigen